MKVFKHIGLFEGIGGFSYAAKLMGWKTVAWCEINEFGQRVLRYHYPEAEGFGDIKKTDFTKYANTIDILTGGFPCQPYSTAGKRLGTEDDRHLWPEMLRAIREIQPRYIVGENVRGLTNWNGGLVFDQVQADMENEGYEVLPFLLPACAVNAPHRRDRIWFVAHSNGSGTKQQHGKINESRQLFQEGNRKEIKQFNKFIGEGRIVANTGGARLPINSRGEQRKIPGPAKSFPRSKFSGTFTEGTAWQNFPTQPPVCSGNDGVSGRLSYSAVWGRIKPRTPFITFAKWRNESIKAMGNAVVPQLVIQIFKAIEHIDNLTPCPSTP